MVGLVTMRHTSAGPLMFEGEWGRHWPGAHRGHITPAMCREPMRTVEIAAAGQAARAYHQPRSAAPWHKTRPTGRLAGAQVIAFVVPSVSGARNEQGRLPLP